MAFCDNGRGALRCQLARLGSCQHFGGVDLALPARDVGLSAIAMCKQFKRDQDRIS